jgi:hypothetical protein
MSENFKEWERDLEKRASEVVKAPPGDVEKAVHDVATQMKDAEYVTMGDRPIDEIIKELEPIGWYYRCPLSHQEIFKAVAEEKREILIVAAGTQKYIFERVKKTD